MAGPPNVQCVGAQRASLLALSRNEKALGGNVADTGVDMSQRNIDLHSRGAAAINAREVPEELLAPGFRMENGVATAIENTYHGAAGWREWMSDLFEVFAEGARYEIEEVIADGDDFVVAMVRVVGRAASSRVPLVFRWSTVVWFHNGKATRVVGYTSPGEALEAVGLHQ